MTRTAIPCNPKRRNGDQFLVASVELLEAAEKAMQDLTTTTLQDGRSINAQRSLGDMTYPHCSFEQFNVTSSAISTELVIYCRSLRSTHPSLIPSHPISS